LGAVGLAASVWAMTAWLRRAPERAEAWLADGWHPELREGLAGVAGVLPFPLAEGMVVVLGIWLLALPFQVRRVQRGAFRGWVLAVFRIARLAALLLAVGQALWGVQYARPGLADRLGIPAAGSVTPETLIALSAALVERANLAYLDVHGVIDQGEPTPRPRQLDPEALEAAWARTVVRWDLPARMAHGFPAPRAMRLTPALRQLGFQGVFVPWTGEGLVMADLIGPAFAYTALHESAHQRGIARESDANAAAYLVALESSDPLLRYAGALALQRQALNALARVDEDAAREQARDRLPGVQRDVEAMVARTQALAGPVSETVRAANHRMLVSQGVQEGVASYEGSLWIVAILSEREGLEALIP
jgi:hypothetical protein